MLFQQLKYKLIIYITVIYPVFNGVITKPYPLPIIVTKTVSALITPISGRYGYLTNCVFRKFSVFFS